MPTQAGVQTVSDQPEKSKGSVEHMVLSNSLTLLALLELLEERGVVKTDDVLKRMDKIRAKAKPD